MEKREEKEHIYVIYNIAHIENMDFQNPKIPQTGRFDSPCLHSTHYALPVIIET